jgi:hypothetical protein
VVAVAGASVAMHELAPALIVTLPVGEVTELTVTVTATVCPKTLVAGATSVTAVVVASAGVGLTVWLTAGDASALKFASPL